MPDTERTEIKLHEGPQTWAASSLATIVVFAGQAGGGKSWWLILEACKYYDDPYYAALIFRKTYKEIFKAGGLWELASQVYPILGGVPNLTNLRWTFPSGAKVDFSHIEDFNINMFRGVEYAFIAFDEANYFPQAAFFLLFSRLRSKSLAPRKFALCCNPDKDSWIKDLIEWYLDDLGFPREDRICKVRWFGRAESELQWFDTEAEAQAGGIEYPTSLTFVPSLLDSNTTLLRADPQYKAKLQIMPAVDRMRFLLGSWNASERAPGDYYQRNWAPVLRSNRLDRVAAGQMLDNEIRDFLWATDLASTAIPGDLIPGGPLERSVKRKGYDADWSVFLEIARFRNGMLCVWNCYAYRDGPVQIQWMLATLVERGRKPATVVLPLDPAQAGEYQVRGYQLALRGAGVKLECLRPKNPLICAEIGSKEMAAGRIYVREGMLGEDLFWQQLEAYPTKGVHDDVVSALALAAMFDLSKPLPVVGPHHSMHGGDYSYRTANDMRAPMQGVGGRTINDVRLSTDFRRLL